MVPDEGLSQILAEATERGGYKVEWYSGKIVMHTSASAFHNLIVPEPVSITVDTSMYPSFPDQ
jgi:hypothetical protein